MLLVQMRGKLEYVELDMTDMEFLNECNMAAVQGKEFVLARKPGDHIIGLAVRNILTFEDADHADLVG